MKLLTYSIFLATILIACTSLPERTNTGGTLKISLLETEYVSVFSVDDYVDDVMQCKGWDKPSIDIAEEAIPVYIAISAVCFSLGVLAFIFAYMSHQHSLIGVGAILLCACAYAIGFAYAIKHLWVIPASIADILIYFGWKFRNKHIKNLFNKDISDGT